jgi:hypothetical protein
LRGINPVTGKLLSMYLDLFNPLSLDLLDFKDEIVPANLATLVRHRADQVVNQPSDRIIFLLGVIGIEIVLKLLDQETRPATPPYSSTATAI